MSLTNHAFRAFAATPAIITNIDLIKEVRNKINNYEAPKPFLQEIPSYNLCFWCPEPSFSKDGLHKSINLMGCKTWSSFLRSQGNTVPKLGIAGWQEGGQKGNSSWAICLPTTPDRPHSDASQLTCVRSHIFGRVNACMPADKCASMLTNMRAYVHMHIFSICLRMLANTFMHLRALTHSLHMLHVGPFGWAMAHKWRQGWLYLCAIYAVNTTSRICVLLAGWRVNLSWTCTYTL